MICTALVALLQRTSVKLFATKQYLDNPRDLYANAPTDSHVVIIAIDSRQSIVIMANTCEDVTTSGIDAPVKIELCRGVLRL